MAIHKWRDIKAKRMKERSKLKQLALKISKPFIWLGELLIWPAEWVGLEVGGFWFWVIGLLFAHFLLVGLGLLWMGEQLLEYSQVYVSGFARDDLEMCDEDATD